MQVKMHIVSVEAPLLGCVGWTAAALVYRSFFVAVAAVMIRWSCGYSKFCELLHRATELALTIELGGYTHSLAESKSDSYFKCIRNSELP